MGKDLWMPANDLNDAPMTPHKYFVMANAVLDQINEIKMAENRFYFKQTTRGVYVMQTQTKPFIIIG